MTTAEWYVPEYDKALVGQWRIATIEYVFTGAGYKIQVTPSTFADVRICNLLADYMNERNNKEITHEGI